MHASTSATASHPGHQRQRHSISNNHQFITTMPSPSDSPLVLPTLLSDDEDMSPTGSTGVLTPPIISISGNDGLQMQMQMSRIITEHSMLQALSDEGSPQFPDSHFDGRGNFPLLSPNYSRDNKRYVERGRDISPPTTPKGHPISKFNSSRRIHLSRTHQIPQPTLRQKLTYLLRVPRRYRPALILMLCVLTFATLYISRASSITHELAATHAKSQPSRLPILTPEQRQQLALMQKEHVKRASAGTKALKFKTKEEEFAAVISSITSSSTSLLPDIDPSVPIDPAMILDFDPTSPRARDDLELIMTEVHAMYPLIVFGKMRDPWHREVKKMLSEYKITPAPIIIELDQRPDAHIFIPLLARLLGSNELPQVTLQGKSLGSYHDVLELREKGTLKATLEASGAVDVKAPKKKKKMKKEMERLENEKVLAPRPIVDGI